MKLWLDDTRPAPPDFVWVRDVTQALCFFDATDRRHWDPASITFASLDHDLGTFEGWDADKHTGYAVVKWMEDHDSWPEDGVAVHSKNPEGKKRMEEIVMRHYGRLFEVPV